MARPFDEEEVWSTQREKIIGLGERSLRKTYYPELQQKMDELERFRALLDQSNDCIFLLHAKTLTFVDVNESACRQLECPRGKFLTLTLGDFVSSETIIEIRNLVAAKGAERQKQGTITTDLHKCSGAAIPAEMTIRLVTFNDTLYGVVVARDISERKRAEEVLLENSRMLRDLELARQIQLSLLPRGAPELPGLGLGGICVPAAHVGGDYYDYYLRDGAVDLVVADVSGHSLGAALIMAEARSVLRAQIHSFSTPGEIVASLNHILFADLYQSDLFITLFYMKYDTTTGILTYVNAGHVPPLLLRRGTLCEELDAEGLILGIREEVHFEEKKLQVQREDLLLLFTDGVIEAQNAEGELFGTARLCSTIAARKEEPAQDIINGVIEAVTLFTGSATIEDDMTMVVMKVF